ncbi:hypothetical protein HMPREF3216_00062 [Gardnerella vaginalis]|uniref:Uncharacterized protein n=1 Tax=Gardnerella vaginalis TaxID=2702 RepID=A0A133NT91_GARVA|nr:hypothetical protein HMPREF3216_00062 [Gardnerella vaginalis]
MAKIRAVFTIFLSGIYEFIIIAILIIFIFIKRFTCASFL